MQYAFIWKDSNGKEVVKELSSGCWGATGRLDQYNPLVPKRQILDGLPYDDDFTLMEQYKSSSSYFATYPVTTHVRIRSDHSCYQHIFRKEMYEIMDYFVHRSPFRVLFHQQWAEQFKANSLDFDCREVPAVITIVALIWLRDSIGVAVGNTFRMLVEGGIPEGVAFLTALNQPALFASGISEYGRNGYEATPSENEWCVPFFCDPECTLDTWNNYWYIPQQSCVTLGGYPVCMCVFWAYPKKGIKLTSAKYARGVHNFRKNQTINGLFGSFTFNGCTDPIQYTKFIWGLE